jgi:gliding motility-associated-like protein
MRTAVIIIFLFLAWPADAQTCTGSLGDPIANITFGQGTGPGPALAEGVTNLMWQPGGCPNDGYYALENQESACYGGSWLTVPHDHTGNPGGYFMLCNASINPNDFYVQTVSGLCGGTTFQFAAWILNMVDFQGEILPNITFHIEKTDGTVLATYNTGDIPIAIPATWVQYGFYFNTPPGISTVVLRMTNNASGGVGNDLALDDITFRAAGPAIQANIVGLPGDTVMLCQNDPRTLSFQGVVENCYASPVYQWQQSTDSGVSWLNIAGATTTAYPRSQTVPGNYLYRLAVAQSGNIGIASCEVASLPLAVDVVKIPSPAVTISPYTGYACQDSPVNFVATPVDGGLQPSYQWVLNGNPVGPDTAAFATSSLKNGDILDCIMTSNATCVINPVTSSNNVSLNIIPIPVTGVSIAASATDICADSLVSFDATPINGGSAPDYQWQLNGANVGIDSSRFADAGLADGDVVNCKMTGSLTCSPTVTAAPAVKMMVHPLPVVQLTPDTIIAGGTSLRLQPLVIGDIANYNWTPVKGLEDAGMVDPMASPAGTTTYHLEVVSVDGCRASAQEAVEVYYDVRLPLAFTPNGDGHNDLFRVPQQSPVTVKQLSVYNRLGQRVFSTTNTGEGWDGNYHGSPQPSGVYVWWVEYINPLTRRSERKKGTVILIR